MHDIIYLIPDEYEGEYLWCQDPAPGIGMEEKDAIKYMRPKIVCDCEYAGKCYNDSQKADYCPLRKL